MREFLDIYRYNPLLILNQLLMLAAVIYAFIRLTKHPGPSICLVIASVLSFGGFVVWVIVFQVIDVDYDSIVYKIFRHTNSAADLVSMVLLYIAVFGWRGTRDEVRLEMVPTAAAGPTAPAGPVPAASSEGIRPVRIPVGWVMTLTILMAVAVPILTIAFIAAIVASADDPDSMIGLFIVLGIASVGVIIVGIVLPLEILYRAWKAIQDGHARTTPGRAVGFLFIPFFSFYWIFVAWAGLAKDFNAFLSRYGIPVRRLSEGLFTTYCVLAVAGVIIGNIPVLGTLYAIGEVIISLVVLWSITGRVNELYAYLQQAQNEPPTLATA